MYPESSHPFRSKNETIMGDSFSGELSITDNEQILLWVHQTDWQKQLLGNTISLIDATYKTTELALFFIIMCMLYSVVAEFIIQVKQQSIFWKY